MPYFSSNLTHVTIGGYYENVFKHILNLNTLELIGCSFQDGQQESFPGTRGEFSEPEGVHKRRKVLPTLKKLTISKDNFDLKETRFPEGLVELTVSYIDFRNVAGEEIKFPSSLKKLKLTCSSLNSLGIVEFPSGLESLSLGISNWTPIEPIRFPPYLKELTLNVSLTVRSLADPCGLLPATLEYLDINNIKCPKLPKGLKVLKIMTFDRITQFPKLGAS